MIIKKRIIKVHDNKKSHCRSPFRVLERQSFVIRNTLIQQSVCSVLKSLMLAGDSANGWGSTGVQGRHKKNCAISQSTSTRYPRGEQEWMGSPQRPTTQLTGTPCSFLGRGTLWDRRPRSLSAKLRAVSLLPFCHAPTAHFPSCRSSGKERPAMYMPKWRNNTLGSFNSTETQHIFRIQRRSESG